MTTTTLRARVALAELEALGPTIEDLVAVAGTPDPTPTATVTLTEYLPGVRAAYPPRTRRTYNSYWMLAEEMFGSHTLDAITSDDVSAIADEAAQRARRRRAGTDGRASRESAIAAVRAVFTRAQKAGIVRTNPALLVDKPRRLESRRRALSQRELEDVWAAVSATTKDPDLDLLLLRFHLETGARRMGAINLRLGDLDPEGDWPRLDELPENVPNKLRRLIARATDYDTKIRPQTAVAFKTDLDKATPATSFRCPDPQGALVSDDDRWCIRPLHETKVWKVEVLRAGRRRNDLGWTGSSSSAARKHLARLVQQFADGKI